MCICICVYDILHMTWDDIQHITSKYYTYNTTEMYIVNEDRLIKKCVAVTTPVAETGETDWMSYWGEGWGKGGLECKSDTPNISSSYSSSSSSLMNSASAKGAQQFTQFNHQLLT